ncbi:MAG: aminotransferase DegT [Thermotoga sp.]|nr:MAG: aminotransferase DegT [Thermotoga sp.]
MKKSLAIFGGKPVRTKECPPWPIYNEALGYELLNTLKNGGFSELTGKKSKEFGAAFASKMGVKYGIPVSNGTSAIHLALIGLKVDPGDEILVPAHTFIGSASPILMQNAIPVFVDIDEDTYTMDPDDLDKKITDRSKVVIVVHLNGNPANMDRIMKIARSHNLKVIEDCAQAHGAVYKDQYVGSIGDVGTFSFWEDKIMTTGGEGGMVITNDEEIMKKICSAKSHGEMERKEGEERKYVHEFLGYNYRITEFQATYGLYELGKLDEYIEKRRKNADYLTKRLSKLKGVYTPKEIQGGKNVFYKYIVKVDGEKLGKDVVWIKDALKAEGIKVESRYPLPLHFQPLFQEKNTYGDSSWPYACIDKKYEYKRGLCPVAEKIGRKLLTLLVHPTIDEEYLNDVSTAFYKVWEYILS